MWRCAVIRAARSLSVPEPLTGGGPLDHPCETSVDVHQAVVCMEEHAFNPIFQSPDPLVVDGEWKENGTWIRFVLPFIQRPKP